MSKHVYQIRYPKTVKTNTTDLEAAIREGCNPMHKVLDPDHGYLPYFGNVMSGDDPGNAHHVNYSLSHVPGRWLNALLNAEDAVGVKPDEKVIRILQDWTYKSFAHSMGLSQSMDLNTFQIIRVSNLHNLRESTLAMYALAKYRGEKKALKLAQKQIDTVNRYFDYGTGRWDEDGFSRRLKAKTNYSSSAGKSYPASETYPFPPFFGRYIGALVKLYKASGMEEALTQAIKLKDYTFQHVLNEKGDYDVKIFGDHIHSTTSMISSLAMLGEILGDGSITDRVKAFMKRGLGKIALDFGWCIERFNRKDLVGEANNTADILETCLILGHGGDASYYQQAERILRSHLLPSQLLDTSFIPECRCPNEDYHHQLSSRSKGAFGFPCPFGHEFETGSRISYNWDIVGGSVDGLCHAFRRKVTKNGSLTSVNLHFDHKDREIIITSPYTNRNVMEVKLKKKTTLRIRLSDWTDKNRIRITVDNQKSRGLISGDWLYLTGLRSNSTARVVFPKKKATVDYRFRDHRFSFTWVGDQVVAATSGEKRLCFFKSM